MRKRNISFLFAVFMLLALACGCLSVRTQEPISTVPPVSAEPDIPSWITPPESPAPSEEPEESFPDYITVACGESYTVDLNGDGQDDEVFFQPDESSPWTISSLSVNGTEFSDSIYNDGFFCDQLSASVWAITDLDSGDELLEVAIMDYGPSSDEITHFFRYDGSSLNYIGYVPGFVYSISSMSSDMTFNRDGTVASYVRLNVLQTWWAPAVWTPGDDVRFDLLEQDLYYPFEDGYGTSVTVSQPVAAYAERSTESERSLLPAGTALKLIATDNREWVLARQDTGEEVWLHLNGQNGYAFNVEVTLGYEFGASVLDGLCMAD